MNTQKIYIMLMVLFCFTALQSNQLYAFEKLNIPSISYEKYKQKQPGKALNLTLNTSSPLNKLKEITENSAITIFSLLVILLLLIIIFVTFYIYNKKSARLNKILSAQNDELELLNKQKDEFFSFVAHDLKNPISNIMGFAELMSRNFEKQNYQNVRRYTQQIYNSTKLLNSLVDRLLDWSRLQRGSIKFEPKTLDVISTIKDVLELYKEQAEEQKITLTLGHIAEKYVFADKKMLLFILKNLILNAIKFNKKGGQVKVYGKSTSNYAFFSVEDTGIGIDTNELEKLFRIDIRKNRQGNTNNHGNGLGLIICNDMIKKNGGEIWVESQPGMGSKFTFSLPVPRKNSSVQFNDEPNPYIKILTYDRNKREFSNEFIDDIKNRILPYHEKVSRILSVEDLKQYAQTLTETGKKYKVYAIEKYGNDLTKHCRTLQFDKILNHLNSFVEIASIILQEKANR